MLLSELAVHLAEEASEKTVCQAAENGDLNFAPVFSKYLALLTSHFLQVSVPYALLDYHS